MATLPRAASSLALAAGSAVSLILASIRLSASVSIREMKKLATEAILSTGRPASTRLWMALM